MDVADRLVGAFASISDVGLEFGQSIADLSSITGIAGEELAELEAKSRRLGKESGLGAGAAARAYSLLASQIEISKIGIEGLNILEERSVTLAHASGMSLDGAANALAATINQFGLGADAADRVINVLAAGSKYGAAEIEDLAESFKIVGSSASAMGLDVESTAGALEILSQANLKGHQAGTALRNIILKLNTELGVDLGETSLGTALDALKPKLSDATFLAKVFGIENIAAAQFLIQNAAAVDEMTEKLTGTSVATEQAAVRTSSGKQSMLELRATVDGLKISFTNALGSLAPWAVVISENVDTIAVLYLAITKMCSGIGSLNQFVIKLTGSSILHNVAAKAAAAATAVWTAAQKALNFVLTNNPIGYIILAVAALVAGVIYAYNHFEGFRNLCNKVWGAIKNLASAVWDHLVVAFDKVSGAVKKAWEWLKKFFGVKGDADVQDTASAIDAQTESLEQNTNAKKKNAGFVIDFSKVGQGGGGDDVPVANPRTYKELADAVAYYEKQLQETLPTEQETITMLLQKIAGYKEAQAAIEAHIAAASRPTELNTLEAIDAELQYQQSLRSRATAENIAAIDAEILRLNGLRTAFEEAAHVEVGIDQIHTYEQLESELTFYQEQLQRATESERAEIMKRIHALEQLKEKWEELAATLHAPADISQLSSIGELDDAIAYYSARQKTASAEEIVNIQRIVDALTQKRDALNSLTEIPSMERELGALNNLSGLQLVAELKLIGLDAIRSKIRSLQELLDNTSSPLNEEQRKEVEGMINSWQDYGNVLASTTSKGDLAAGAMNNISSVMSSLSGVVGEGAGGWLSYGANILSAVAAVIPALASVINSNIAMGFSGAIAQSQTLPPPFNFIQLAAGLAAVGAAVASIPKFADGGIAYGPTLGIFGEYAGAATNPEVVAPLNKLKAIIGTDGGSDGGDVEFRIEGRALVGILKKANKIKRRTK